MTEDDLRALVRQAVSRHLEQSAATAGAVPGESAGTPGPGVHPSFRRYLLAREPGHDDRCLIEPAVKCNHCGYCQSHGF